jgi:hypoxanthine phosphoribosyltransferase
VLLSFGKANLEIISISKTGYPGFSGFFLHYWMLLLKLAIFANLSKTLMSKVKLKDKIFNLSVPAEKIQSRIDELALKMNEEMKGMDPLFIVILNGAFLFASDLIKKINVDCEVTFVRVASYNGTESTGKIRNLLGLHENVNDRNVVIIEDIVDRGETIQFLLSELNKFHPACVKVATLLFKPDALKFPVDLHYVGFEVPNDFFVGFGLDYNGLGRNLNDIYVLEN